MTLSPDQHTIAAVRLWHAHYDPKARVVRHTIARGCGHALFAPFVCNVFEALRVSAAVWEHGVEWFAIHVEANVSSFELEHGKDTERGLYNHASCLEAGRRGTSIRREHAGYADYFVPIVMRGKVVGILVAGPVALARPTSAEIQQRWRSITGRQARPADPEFASYLGATLSTLVLDGTKADAFERLLGCLAKLMGGEGSAERLINEATVLRAELETTRYADQVWEIARTMVDDRSSMIWQSAYRASDLAKLGLVRLPDHVLVALMAARTPEPDPVDDAVRRDALQRSAVELARKAGGVIAGRVGDHGVVFLAAGSGTPQKQRRALRSLAESASQVARRRYGMSLHFGVCIASQSMAPSRIYQLALGAAESAQARGVGLVTADAAAARSPVSQWQLRRELAQILEEGPALMSARFDRYIEAVALQCGYRVDSVRAQLQIGFERMAEALLDRCALDDKSFEAMRDALDRGALAARTTSELSSEYRRAVADMLAIAQRPVHARQDQSLRRALDYIQQHYVEELSLEKVASVAGFESTYFSKLFVKREGVSFTKYVASLRLERAKQLLASTDLDAARVAEMSGFGSAQYFSSVFRAATGVTPLAWRREPARLWAAGKAKYRNRKH